MPQEFDKCVQDGGQVRTKTMPGGKYMHICYKGGKAFPGEVKKKDEVRPHKKGEES